MRTRGSRLPLALAVVAGIVVAGVPGVRGAAQTAEIPPGPQTPAVNPAIADSCGTDVVLVLDASGSINSAGAVGDVRNAAEAFLDALADTGSSARVLQFASFSEQLAPQAEVTAASLLAGGPFRTALNRYYNPIPPRPAGTTIYNYNGSGNPQSAGNWTVRNNNNQYTNWDQSIKQAAQAQPRPTELVVYVTDGDPTAYDFDQAGDPFVTGPPRNVGVNTARGQANATTLDRAVQEANQVKTGGARMLAVGVGNAVTGNAASISRLTQIAGPQVVTDAQIGSITSINEVDVALVRDFDRLAQFLRSVVNELCSPSLTVRKLAQSADSAEYAPAPGWSLTATPSVTGGTYTWVLPDTDPDQAALCGNPANPADQAPRTCTTDANGLASFQWEPDPSDAQTSAVISEVVQPGFTPGRPGDDNDWTCTLKSDDGSEEVVSGELSDDVDPSFQLDIAPDNIITCSLYNSFDYEPAIALTKADDPTVVRGDLTPPAQVTSTFQVTNPGNTPLSFVTVIDDRCTPAPVESGGTNVGDVAPANGLLDPGETWVFSCVRRITSPASTDPAGSTVQNTARAFGTDPTGTTVVSDPATAQVTAFNPAIAVTKLVDGAPAVTVVQGESVTYTYRVTNAGNTPLGTVTLVDDTPPCQTPTRGPDNPGDNDAVLGLTEAWEYTCGPTSAVTVVNTATVTGTPLNPLGGNTPFPNPNPTVTATAVAQVTVVAPGIRLTKLANPTVVLLGPDGDPESVTYSFAASNTGDTPLDRPDTAGTKDPGWIVDARCTSPATYVDGDDGNDLLDPDETWNFTCTGEVDQPTVNTASITGQPLDPDTLEPVGDTISDSATAFVDVVRPGIAVDKRAVTPVVFDPAAVAANGGQAVLGPDVPTPRPAEYRYEVTNTGNVPLAVDPSPPVDDTCGPLVYVGGDTNSDDLLDVGEVWVYTCATTLSRADANTPPVTGAESGLVTNTVTVTGVPYFEQQLVPDKSVTATDTAQVLVIQPAITLTKTPSATVVRAGSDVTYTFVVANTGDVGLDVIGPNDDLCSPLVYVGGDTNSNGILDGANSGAAESWVYTCTRAVGLPAPPATTVDNTAIVGAVGPLGNLLVAEDTASVRVFDPAIRLVKTARKTLVPAGTTVTYDFAVSNAGDSPIPADDVLANISLVDVASPPQPSCSSPAYVDGDDGDGLLDLDEVWNYVCSARVAAPTTNVAVVSGVGGTQFDPPIPVTVTASSAAFVAVFTPGIEVVKTASPEVLPPGGGTVTYTYEVRNTGNVPLAGVKTRITDDKCSPVTYVSGDLDGDNLLDTGSSIFEDASAEVWIFRCVTTLTQTTVNTVVVTGSPTDNSGAPLCGVTARSSPRIAASCDVTDRDTARVVVLPVEPPLPPIRPPIPPLPETGTGTTGPILALAAAVGLAGLLILTGSRRRTRRT